MANDLRTWLELHCLTPAAVSTVLNDLTPEGRAAQTPSNATTLSAKDAWALAMEALTKKFPGNAQSIERAAHAIELECVAEGEDVQQPFTLDRSPDKAPLVSIRYSVSAADILAVAHEFGHAVQLTLGGGRFIPPIQREIAAFLSELALLEYSATAHSPIAADLQAAHSADDLVYLHADATQLARALGDPGTPYSYRWNYTIARVLAAKSYDGQGADTLWNTFLGKEGITRLMATDRRKHVPHKTENYLLPAPKPDRDHPAINRYRSLGMMALLDIDYWKGESEREIGDYYAALRSHMQDKSALIAFAEDMKPIGYAIWERHPESSGDIRITRQAAPFGHHFELQKRLRSRLSEAGTVMSIHARSAREVQAAW